MKKRKKSPSEEPKHLKVVLTEHGCQFEKDVCIDLSAPDASVTVTEDLVRARFAVSSQDAFDEAVKLASKKFSVGQWAAISGRGIFTGGRTSIGNPNTLRHGQAVAKVQVRCIGQDTPRAAFLELIRYDCEFRVFLYNLLGQLVYCGLLDGKVLESLGDPDILKPNPQRGKGRQIIVQP
jgi:hypothetical protein